MNSEVDLEEIKQKLYARLKPSGWGDKLKTFILSEDFTKILQQLLVESRAGQRFTPPLKQVFRAFEECPYGNLMVVMMGQDPYPYLNVADGIAFSCSNDMKPQASLRFMLKEVEETIYPMGGYTWDPDLKRWSNQGMLIINAALTTSIGKIGSHYDLWQPFMAFLFDMLTSINTGLIYVFMGKKAQEFADLVPDNELRIYTTHPASAAYSNLERWDSGNMFVKVSDLARRYYKQDIIW